MLLGCGVALSLGGTTERQGAAIYFVSWIGSMMVMGDNLAFGYLALTAIDVVMFGCLALLAWKSGRAWPAWASAFQAIELLADISKDLGLKVNGIAMYSAVNIASYGVIATMIIGAVVAWREREALKSFGIDDQLDSNSPARARSMSSSVRPTPKMATKDPKRGPWF
jgi:hypothetical protein